MYSLPRPRIRSHPRACRGCAASVIISAELAQALESGGATLTSSLPGLFVSSYPEVVWLEEVANLHKHSLPRPRIRSQPRTTRCADIVGRPLARAYCDAQRLRFSEIVPRLTVEPAP